MSGAKSKFTSNEVRVLFFAFFSVVIGLMAVDFFNPSLPTIQKDLDVGQGTMKNLIVFYMIVLGLAQFFYGSFSDAKGRKIALATGLGVAAVGLFVGYTAHSIVALDISRVLTALGTASCTVISRALIVDTLQEPGKLRKAFSYFSMASQLSPAIAPLIGSFIGVHFGWHVQFLLFAVAVVAGLIMIASLMPETHPASARNQGRTGKVQAYTTVLKNVNFTSYSIASALIFSFTIAFYATAPFAFDALGVSPVGNSLFYILYAVSIICGSFCNSWISWSPTDTYIRGLVAYLVVFVVSAFSDLDSSLVKIGLFSVALGFISGMIAPLTLTLSMTTVETARGAASAVQGAIKMFFTGLLLLVFDSVVITGFTAIVLIFIGFAVALLALYMFTTAANRKEKVSA
ncbi:MFS transporter [Streptomyces roseoverticillatus]|uniref:MFS transporter n=1 Tax=Streptomyces roseoverticillatus TaxID=66429 RepID=UPI0004BF19D9|nr:MFS transporter [Streptomyces roseoverticillatus]